MILALKSSLKTRFPDLDLEALSRVEEFRLLLLKENERQNLTRLTTVFDFIEGHFLDCYHLTRSFGHSLAPTVIDLGSGCGVPGLLSCIIDKSDHRRWVLLDSERTKVDFLARVVTHFGLDNRVSAVWSRAELFFRGYNENCSIISRAVGPLSRIFPWIADCSTWNSLFLFKGPSWENEWQKTPASIKRKVAIIHAEEYKTIHNQKRVIIEISRVPRGT